MLVECSWRSSYRSGYRIGCRSIKTQAHRVRQAHPMAQRRQPKQGHSEHFDDLFQRFGEMKQGVVAAAPEPLLGEVRQGELLAQRAVDIPPVVGIKPL